MSDARRNANAGTRRLRILHCPTDVGGNSTGLSRAERSLGAASDVAVIQRSGLGYEVDIDLALGEKSRIVRLAHRAAFLARSLSKYDVFHFNFGQALLPQVRSLGVDLPLLRALGKRVYMTFQGCDARQTAFLREHCEISCCGRTRGEGLCRAEQDRDKRNAIAYAARHCHRLFCVNPDLLRFVPNAEFVPYASVDPRAIEPAPSSCSGRLTIAHAPTNRAVKGTDAILRALASLRAKHDFNLLLVEGVPHGEAMSMYARADLVIDQLRVGWYGALAVEAMALAKPVISYVRESDLEFLPRAMADELPVISATKESIAHVVDDLLGLPHRLRALGERGRAYVERWHDPRMIAKRLLAIYQDPAEPFWKDERATAPLDSEARSLNTSIAN